jgi:hypothetical protein
VPGPACAGRARARGTDSRPTGAGLVRCGPRRAARDHWPLFIRAGGRGPVLLQRIRPTVGAGWRRSARPPVQRLAFGHTNRAGCCLDRACRNRHRADSGGGGLRRHCREVLRARRAGCTLVAGPGGSHRRVLCLLDAQGGGTQGRRPRDYRRAQPAGGDVPTRRVRTSLAVRPGRRRSGTLVSRRSRVSSGVPIRPRRVGN